MRCPRCKTEMLLEGYIWKCRTCPYKIIDPGAIKEIRLNEIRKIRDEGWNLQERMDNEGCIEASEKMNEVADLLTEDIDLD